MFEPSSGPRLFGLPPGADFPAELVRGLTHRLRDHPPEAWAEVQIFVNTRRMQRRLMDLLAAGQPRLLPRLKLVTDLDRDPSISAMPPPAPPLRRKLELSQLIDELLRADPTLAPRAAKFDLADSLSAMMDEMHGEGVTLDDILSLDISDQSGHWARALRFIEIASQYGESADAPDAETRRRAAVDAIERRWTARPPDGPVIVAGSTGSRGTTQRFMEIVARLPQGAILLPGFDFDQPSQVWAQLADPLESEDHPQYRFAQLLTRLDVTPAQVSRWSDADPVPDRNKLISLALRPAPITDQWLTDGPNLPDLAGATSDMTLIEAPTPRQEALAIAICLREAVENGQRAALITPDRTLSRQVAAALDRWRITPDDSAGRPLALSAPGRLLRHVARFLGQAVTAETLLTLLKHPLVHSGGAGRADHLRFTRDLELWLRRTGLAALTSETLDRWAAGRKDAGAGAWIAWLAPLIRETARIKDGPLADLSASHIQITEKLAAGAGADASGTLWQAAAGSAAQDAMAELFSEASAGGTISLADYAALIDSVLNAVEVRDPVLARPDVMIWGTLEARVQGADLLVLGGLSEGTWPERPAPDPWLNRQIRRDAGMLLPERRIGLSAHDFQQAIAAKAVVLTRSTRDADAETVVSRWLNRLMNLMQGLPQRNGPDALQTMRARGQRYLKMARAADIPAAPHPPAKRPAPRPPENARPRTLSVTRIETLIRDPYAVYARDILRLRALDPLRPKPDAPLRGIVTHGIVEDFIRLGMDPATPQARDAFLEIASRHFAAKVPWPTAQRLWQARLARVADWFLAGEVDRQAVAQPLVLEGRGHFDVPHVDVTIKGQADRIDQQKDGRLIIYDYKTGGVPTAKEVQHFSKQLLIEAIMAENGAFADLPPAEVASVTYIGLGNTPAVSTLNLRDHEAEQVFDPGEILDELTALLQTYARRDQGYLARRAVASTKWSGDYDHLARFGEWTDSDPGVPEDVG